MKNIKFILFLTAFFANQVMFGADEGNGGNIICTFNPIANRASAILKRDDVTYELFAKINPSMLHSTERMYVDVHMRVAEEKTAIAYNSSDTDEIVTFDRETKDIMLAAIRHLTCANTTDSKTHMKMVYNPKRSEGILKEFPYFKDGKVHIS